MNELNSSFRLCINTARRRIIPIFLVIAVLCVALPISTAFASGVTAPDDIYWNGTYFYTDENYTAGSEVKVDGQNVTKMDVLINSLDNNTTIHMNNTLSYIVSGTESWASDYEVTIMRKLSNRMITIPLNGTLNCGNNITIDGTQMLDVSSTGIEVVGTMNITDGATIKDFSVNSNGAAIYVNGGTVNMSGGYITDNMASSTGGALYIRSGSFVMTGGVITANSANNRGGAINLVSGTVDISGGMIVGNTAADGADIANTAGIVTVTGGSVGIITGNYPVNDEGETLSHHTFDLTSGNADAIVDSVQITDSNGDSYSYGCEMNTDSNGKLYLWLPAGCTINSVSLNNGTTVYNSTVNVPHAEIKLSSIVAGATFQAVLFDDTPVSYQWKRNNVNITGATGSTYATIASDIGESLTVEIVGASGATYQSQVVIVQVNNPTYSVTIPESVVIVASTNNVGNGSVNVSANLSGFISGQRLSVSVHSDNYGGVPSTYHLIANSGNLSLPYTISTQSNGATPLSNNAQVASFETNGSYTVTLNIETETPLYSANYSDTLTFTVSMGTIQ